MTPVRAPGSLSKKWIARASAMVMASAALTLEPAVSLLGQARASTAWRHRAHEPYSSLQATAFFPPLIGDTEARPLNEAVEDQLATARSHSSGSLKAASFSRPIFINSLKFMPISGPNTDSIHLSDDYLFAIGIFISCPEAGGVERADACLDSDVGDALRSPMIDPVDSSILALDDGKVSPLLDFRVPSNRNRPLATGFAIQNDGRVAVSGERITRQHLPDKDEVDAGALAREVALTGSQATPSAAVLHRHSDMNGSEALVVSGIEESAFGPDTIALSGLLVPFSAQMSAGTGPETMNNSETPGPAWDFTLEGSATAGFETNPFLIDLPNTGTASLRLSVLPTFSRQGVRGDVRFSARIEQIEYTEDYDAVQNVGANFESRFKLNERLEGNVDLSFDSGVFVTNLTGLEPVDGAPNDGGGLSGGDDITLLGLDQPRNQYQAGAGLRYQHSERDELGVSVSFRADRFEGQDRQELQETDFLAGQISYTRQISSGLTIGMAVDASSIDFAEQSLGEITTISPQAIVGLTFSPAWELTGSFGIASIRSDTSFSEETSTAFSGDFSICRNGVRANLCLTGARQVVPFGVGGAGLQSNVGVAYSLRLSERETFSMNANYGKASETILAGGEGIETISGFVGYQLELAERVRLSADARYTDLRLDLGTNVSNFQVLVGLTVSVGRAR